MRGAAPRLPDRAGGHSFLCGEWTSEQNLIQMQREACAEGYVSPVNVCVLTMGFITSWLSLNSRDTRQHFTTETCNKMR